MKIGIISDIHEDIKRLKEAFIILKKQKCEQIICLGDFSGYSVPYYGFLWSRNAHEVIKIIKNSCSITIVGNHDLNAAKKVPKYKAGFEYPKNYYSLNFFEKKAISERSNASYINKNQSATPSSATNKRDKASIYLYENNELPALLTKEDIKYIKSLPEFLIKKFGQLQVCFSHYAYPDLTGSTSFEPVTPSDVSEHFAFMKKHGCRLGISGHDHKEGIMIFTENEVREIPFNKNVKLTSNLTWLHGPSVANGTFANGVLYFDTDKMHIKAIPLKTKKHIAPEWRKL
jgi:UDP-2,3-diacylglucosamine pyrophosphatase LpxH